jgi:hypothetical protein
MQAWRRLYGEQPLPAGCIFSFRPRPLTGEEWAATCQARAAEQSSNRSAHDKFDLETLNTFCFFRT